MIDNSIKYSKQDVPVKVNIDYKEFDDHWQFCIEDNGIGIAKENHNTIFEKYNRINDKNESDGSGIGLAIVKEIIVKLKGEIWVESSLGEGASVYFTLPKN